MFTRITEHSSIGNYVYATYPVMTPHQADVEMSQQYRRFKGVLGGTLNSDNVAITTESLEESAKHCGLSKDDITPKIIIRHVSVNHPACNLDSMETYYRAYTCEGEKAAMFHINRNYCKFDEVVLPNQVDTYPMCGNPGCTYDLSNVRLDVIDCPGCGNPILNRCGNLGCDEQNLHRYKEMQGDSPSLYCPSCGKYVRTRWWRCERHHRDMARSDAFCKDCLNEYQKGEISFDQVQRNENIITSIECPGCITLNKSNPARIDFLDVFDEVGFDKIGRALDIFHNKTKQGKCGICNSLLLPICPDWDPTANPEPHFIQRGKASDSAKKMVDEAKACGEPLVDEYRGVGLFVCTHDQFHAKECYYECSHCGMPLSAEADECPRCRNTIKELAKEAVDDNLSPVYPGFYRELDSFERWLHTQPPMKPQLSSVRCRAGENKEGPDKQTCQKYKKQEEEAEAASQAPPERTDMEAAERILAESEKNRKKTDQAGGPGQE